MRSNKLLLSLLILSISIACENDAALNASGGTGQGGSMTRFAVSGNYLYLLDNTNIKVFGIALGKFEQLQELYVGWGMETIFAKGEYLYLGAREAMYIYSVTDPESPLFIFRYQHLVSCDPVVVQGNRAYVTMRGGSSCNRGMNALEIIDITDRYNPRLIVNYPMETPHGLGIDQTRLFICQGEKGLSVLDVSDEKDPGVIAHRDDFFAYDVIVREGLATITGEDGIFQFSYSHVDADINLISKIPVFREDL
ncbi:MAG: hypothetical protein WEB30_07180 [Cyclobacteriaceae bacterium]